MYRLGHQIKHHRLPYTILGLVIVAAVVAGVLVARHYVAQDTVLTQSEPMTRHISVDNDKVQRVEKDVFIVDLPAGWRAATNPGTPYTVYSWQGAKGEAAARRIDIYIDKLPVDLAVNRLLPVQVDEKRITLLGPVSDNCASFTDNDAHAKGEASVAAKWYGVNFKCDVANYLRNVVATGSTEGINRLTLTGEANGAHEVLLVYTDHSSNPDYTIFTNIVESFRIR